MLVLCEGCFTCDESQKRRRRAGIPSDRNTHTQQHNNKQNTDIAVSKQHRIKMRERRKRSEPPVASPGLSYLPDVPLSEFAEVAVSRFKIRICVAMQVDHVRELLDPSNCRTDDDIGQKRGSFLNSTLGHLVGGDVSDGWMDELLDPRPTVGQTTAYGQRSK